mmetsp:Transcript_9401/g.38428  ORF Transcript_9401/g.38428 Transcript_9401/m.38428 type:complete len:269 (+) Transcript_9401:739-1545(+)
MFAPFFPPPKRAIASASSRSLSASTTTGGSFDAWTSLAGTRVVPKAQSSQSAGVAFVDSARRTSVPPAPQPSSTSAAVAQPTRTLWNQSAFAPPSVPPEPPAPNPSPVEPQSDPIAHADTTRTPRLASPPSERLGKPKPKPTSPRGTPPASARDALISKTSSPSPSSSPCASGPHHLFATDRLPTDRTSARVSHVITADESTRAGETTPAKTQRVSPAFSDPLDGSLGAPPTASPGPARCAPATDTTSAPHESRGKTVRTLASGATAY